MFAANLRPSDTFLAKYDTVSIKTNKGNKAKGHPSGTRIEKNIHLYIIIPKIVHPNTRVKLMKKVRMKCEVGAKLYGTIPTKLLVSIYANIQKNKGI